MTDANKTADEGWAIIVWQHSDGRRLPFNHPDARKERRAALDSWRGVYPDFNQTDAADSNKGTEVNDR